MDEILIDSKWNCIGRNHISDMLLYYFMLMKLLGKYCYPMYSFTVYRIHDSATV